MALVGLPGAMAASVLNPLPNRSLVEIRQIGGQDYEIDVRASISTKKGRWPIFPWVGMVSGVGEVPRLACASAAMRSAERHFLMFVLVCGQKIRCAVGRKGLR